MRHRKRGFSLLELLIVIGVMMVLMGMAVISYNLISRSVASRQTRTTLENLKAMLDELNAEAGPDALPSYSDTTPAPNTVPIPVIGYGITSTDVQDWSISDVTSGTSNNDRYGNIVNHTAAAMATLMRSTKNKEAVAQIPAKLILRDASNNALGPTVTFITTADATVGTPVPAGPVLLDGWGNPIIYVPAGGINVYITNGSTPTQITIKSRDGRPFFASAGPDGDFGARTNSSNTAPTHGDDNVYSTEN